MQAALASMEMHTHIYMYAWVVTVIAGDVWGRGGLDFQWADGHFALQRARLRAVLSSHSTAHLFFFMTWGLPFKTIFHN